MFCSEWVFNLLTTIKTWNSFALELKLKRMRAWGRERESEKYFNTHFEFHSSNSAKLGEGIQQWDKNFKYFSNADNSFSHD